MSEEMGTLNRTAETSRGLSVEAIHIELWQAFVADTVPDHYKAFPDIEPRTFLLLPKDPEGKTLVIVNPADVDLLLDWLPWLPEAFTEE